MTVPSGILPADEYFAIPRPEQSWLIKSILPVGGMVMIYGDPKAGKSYASLQMAINLGKGEDWLGFKTTRKARTVYIMLDTAPNLWVNDEENFLKRCQLMGEKFENIWFADQDTLRDIFPFNALDPTQVAQLKEWITPIEPDLVIFDTLRESHLGDENSSQDMRRVSASLVNIVHPAALLLVHHAKKPSHDGGPDTRNDMRGGYIAGRIDTALRVSHGSISYFGRAVEDDKIKVERRPDGMFSVVTNGVQEALERLLASDPSISTHAAARQLAETTGRTEEACRSLVRRTRAKGEVV